MAIQPVLFLCPVAAFSQPTYREQLIQKANDRHLSNDPYWRLLLHYRRNVVGRLQSEIDEPQFFISETGRRDPQAEMNATLSAFFDPDPQDLENDLHPQCRYPARYAWLREQLNFDAGLPEKECARLAKWREHMRADSISLVFASYYMNNPASMYGHTFLRINGIGHSKEQHLLDYAVNYGAEVDHDNGILFAVKGLAGGYRGKFSTLPYYVKVQEYNNLESRDLWEYRLNLSSASVERFMNHLWEMGSASMAYFFLNKNCSYQILPLIEVADPSVELRSPFWLKATPVDTLRRVISRPGLLHSVNRRPSHMSLMLARRDLLSKTERRAVETLAVDPAQTALLEALPQERQALVLDSAYDLFRYRVGFKRSQPAEVQEKERNLLLLRQKRPTGKTGVEPRSVARPEAGHPTGRFGVSYGFTNRTHFEEISIRPAAHDQEEPSDGYLPGSRLEMFHLKLRYDNDLKTLTLKQLAAVDLVSLTPIDAWIRAPSWKFTFGAFTADDRNKDPGHSLYFGSTVGAGPAVSLPLFRNTMLYSMVEADAGVGETFRDYYRFGGGPSGGILLEQSERLRLRFQGSYFNYSGDAREAVHLLFSSCYQVAPLLGLRAQIRRANQYKEVMFSLLLSLP